MTNEDLLKPRYKLIATYPKCQYEIGDNFIWEEKNEEQSSFEMFGMFPHIFKRLRWWEDRKPNEMPKFILHKDGGVFEVFQWLLTKNGESWLADTGTEYLYISDIMPVLESEYISYENENK
jgi:hypothetical protein